ncbi:conserved hypothetical protein [Vibrio coralliirubri]|nr:conserved hypothetical protein [Vibrio coralliirubri]CDT91683.1 conserved hypothetical protein [Vibrio coralliirubri]
MISFIVKKPSETSPTSLSEQPANIVTIPAAIKAFFIRSPFYLYSSVYYKDIESLNTSVELFAKFLKDVVG